MLRKLAIWYLRKRNCSVLINYIIHEDSIQQKQPDAYIYDNTLHKDAIYLDDDGNIFDIPQNKFKIRIGKGEEIANK